jgi:hypothetical protein
MVPSMALAKKTCTTKNKTRLAVHTGYGLIQYARLVCNENWLGDSHPYLMSTKMVNSFVTRWRHLGSRVYANLDSEVRRFNDDSGLNTTLASATSTGLRKLSKERQAIRCKHAVEFYDKTMQGNFNDDDFIALAASDSVIKSYYETAEDYACN